MFKWLSILSNIHTGSRRNHSPCTRFIIYAHIFYVYYALACCHRHVRRWPPSRFPIREQMTMTRYCNIGTQRCTVHIIMNRACGSQEVNTRRESRYTYIFYRYGFFFYFFFLRNKPRRTTRKTRFCRGVSLPLYYYSHPYRGSVYAFNSNRTMWKRVCTILHVQGAHRSRW